MAALDECNTPGVRETPSRGPLIPPFSVVLTTWRFDGPSAVFLLVSGVAYGVGVVSSRRHGHRWPVRRVVMFYLLGLGSYAVVSFGILGAYAYELRWAFTTKIALLLLLVPWLVGLGKPVALARMSFGDQGIARLNGFLQSRLMRVIGNAVFEPIFTLAVFMLFVTPLAATLRLSPVSHAVVSIVIPVIGVLQALPIMEETRVHSGLALTFEFIVAFGALVFDALPGILLRLYTVVLDGLPSLTTAVPAWFPSAHRDQQLSGDILWFLAEVADIPVIIILFVRWARIDKVEARSIDEISDEEMEALTQAHLHDPRR